MQDDLFCKMKAAFVEMLEVDVMRLTQPQRQEMENLAPAIIDFARSWMEIDVYFSAVRDSYLRLIKALGTTEYITLIPVDVRDMMAQRCKWMACICQDAIEKLDVNKRPIEELIQKFSFAPGAAAGPDDERHNTIIQPAQSKAAAPIKHACLESMYAFDRLAAGSP